MIKAKLVGLVMSLVLLCFFATPAVAQDGGPSLTADPESVAEAGEQTFTVDGSGWTVDAIFLLPCSIPASGDIADLNSETDCDSSALTAVAIVDGSFSEKVTYDVPAEGMVIAGGDANGVEGTAVLVSVSDTGGSEDSEDSDDSSGDDGSSETDAGDDSAEVEVEGEVSDTALPDTGAESAEVAILGAAMLAAGAMVYGFSRRFDNNR